MARSERDPGGAALIVMAKQPSPGRTKTRLTPTFSREEAARLYECFLRDALDLARAVPAITYSIGYAPLDAAPYFRALAPDADLLPQVGATLGERLAHVMTHMLERGFSAVAAINSDSPTLPLDYLVESFQMLLRSDTDVVLGPCEDGGYYLIGWKRPHPRLVLDLEMSTDRVLDETLRIARQEGLRVAQLPVWYDVDDPEDLHRLQSDLKAAGRFGAHTRRFLASHRLGAGGFSKREPA